MWGCNLKSIERSAKFQSFSFFRKDNFLHYPTSLIPYTAFKITTAWLMALINDRYYFPCSSWCMYTFLCFPWNFTFMNSYRFIMEDGINLVCLLKTLPALFNFPVPIFVQNVFLDLLWFVPKKHSYFIATIFKFEITLFGNVQGTVGATESFFVTFFYTWQQTTSNKSSTNRTNWWLPFLI